MSSELTWEDFRAVSMLERVSVSRAALMLALERGEWNGTEFEAEEIDKFLSTASDGTWQVTHKMDATLATGAIKSAHSAILSAMIRELEAGRLNCIVSSREFSGAVNPDKTFATLEAIERFAEVFDLQFGDLWEDYRDRERRITEAAIAAAESARALAESGSTLYGEAGRDYETLPQWARDEIARLAYIAAAPRSIAREDHHQTPGSRERRSLLNVIGCLVETLLSQSPGGQRYSIFASQAALIDTLLARYPRLPGVSQRNLEGLIPKARKSIQED